MEVTPSFKPTYKFDIGTSNWDSRLLDSVYVFAYLINLVRRNACLLGAIEFSIGHATRTSRLNKRAIEARKLLP